MINPLMGASAFVARLLPIFSLKSDLLFEQIEILVKLIHDAGGYVHLVMSDNLSANRRYNKLFHEKNGTTSIAAIPHPSTKCFMIQITFFITFIITGSLRSCKS